VTTPALPRHGWPQVAGEGVPADSPRGHAANALAMLQLYREVSGIGMLPDPVRELLTAVERRLRLTVQGLELMERPPDGGA
jgi:hypothetical protein